jgi:hypothetical protein
MSTLELRYDWDYSDYARLPDDGNRYEIIDGELPRCLRRRPSRGYGASRRGRRRPMA